MTENINHSDYARTWRQNASELRSDSMYTDIILVPKCDSDKRIQCHRIVLASASNYFKNLFNNDTNDVIYLHQDDLTAHILEILLDYMYKAEIRINLENVVLLNKYSDQFCLQELRSETMKFLENNIKFDTCLKYWRHADYLRNEDLMEKCIKYIKGNCEEFMKFSVNDLTDNEMELICKKLRNSQQDSVILNSITTWVKKNFDPRKFKLESLLKNINFDGLSDSDIKRLENDSQLQSYITILKFVGNYYKNNNSLK